MTYEEAMEFIRYTNKLGSVDLKAITDCWNTGQSSG